VRFALRSLFYLQASTAWFRFLKAARQSRPSAMVIDLLQLPHRPFFDRRLTSVERVRMVIEHHHLCRQLFGQELADRLATGRPHVVATIDGKRGEPMELRIAADGRFREGMLSISLVAGGEIAIVMTVTFAQVGGVRSAMIGCLQTSAEGRLERLRELTRDLHGIQPRLLLVQVLRLLCRHMDVGRIEAVSNDNHAFMAFGYGRRRETVKLLYDELWTLVGGEALGNGNYSIPVVVPRKPLEAYPSKKRAEHQRRFALIDAIDAQLAACVERPVTVRSARLSSAA